MNVNNEVVRVMAVALGHYEFLRVPGEVFEYPASLLKDGALPSWVTPATTAAGPARAEPKVRAAAMARVNKESAE